MRISRLQRKILKTLTIKAIQDGQNNGHRIKWLEEIIRDPSFIDIKPWIRDIHNPYAHLYNILLPLIWRLPPGTKPSPALIGREGLNSYQALLNQFKSAPSQTGGALRFIIKRLSSLSRSTRDREQRFRFRSLNTWLKQGIDNPYNLQLAAETAGRWVNNRKIELGKETLPKAFIEQSLHTLTNAEAFFSDITVLTATNSPDIR